MLVWPWPGRRRTIKPVGWPEAISSGSEVDRVTEQRRAGEPSPGWYLDPADSRQQRFWDGSQWTQQVRRVRTVRRKVLLAIGGLLAFWLVVVGILELWNRVEERRLRPGLAKTLDEVVLPAGLRLVGEGYGGNRWCFDACPTLSRRYSSPLSREETYRVFAAELERLGYECEGYCDPAVATAWVQPGKGERSPEVSLHVLLTTDLDKYSPDFPSRPSKDASRPVHADLSVQIALSWSGHRVELTCRASPAASRCVATRAGLRLPPKAARAEGTPRTRPRR
jgi:uncharacterized protein DUF2510